MGVDYSNTVAYGIAILAEEMPAFISDEKYPDELDVQQWLADNRYEYITCEESGNFMSGETVYLFALKGTISRYNPRFDEGVVSFDTPDISPEAGREFRRLCDMFELPWPDSISWKLTFNVS